MDCARHAMAQGRTLNARSAQGLASGAGSEKIGTLHHLQDHGGAAILRAIR